MSLREYYNITFSALPYLPAPGPGHSRTIITFLALLGMPMEMYDESGKRGLQASKRNVQRIAECKRVRGIKWCLNQIRSMKYAEVIYARFATNSLE